MNTLTTEKHVKMNTVPDVWGIASSIDIHECDPAKIRDVDLIKRFVVELCDLIEMKRFG